jgi:hypothetical protein
MKSILSSITDTITIRCISGGVHKFKVGDWAYSINRPESHYYRFEEIDGQKFKVALYMVGKEKQVSGDYLYEHNCTWLYAASAPTWYDPQEPT